MMKKLFAALTVAACALVASPAMSAVVVVTWTGTVFEGIDVGGRFGATGANLAGTAFSAEFTYDTDIGRTYSDGGGTTLIGGTNTGLPAPPPLPPGTATLTINGVDYFFGGQLMSLIATYDEVDVPGGRTLSTWMISNQDPISGGTLQLGGYDNPSLPLSFMANFSGADPCTGPLGCMGNVILPGFKGTLDPDWVTINVWTSGVPEPATWAMLIAGFGLTGAAIRSSRRGRSVLSRA